MRIAVISDIHGNFDAFEKVLDDIARCQVDAIVNLGDAIGYGPEPEQVINTIRTRRIPSISGNHEMAVNDSDHLSWFNPAARKSLLMTIDMLSQQSRDFIADLTTHLTEHQCRFVHGFPPDSPFIYLFQVSDTSMRRVFREMTEPLCFVGHTHLLEMVCYDGSQIDYLELPQGIVSLDKTRRYLINIGSVGQPRDGNNHAKYVIWDSARYSLDVRFVPYDIAKVVGKIRDAGLPEEHGLRLW
jgi:predicted phosphodiesterase